MGLSDKDRKILWGKAGGKCSYRYDSTLCDENLMIQNGDETTVVGKECHIVGEKPNAARHIQNFKEMDTYDNRILMCGTHHDIIDGNEVVYTIDVLKSMKIEHEVSIIERVGKKEIEPFIITDSIFKTEVKDAKEVINMEINRPAQLSNVISELKVTGNVERVIGFSTNQGLTIGSPKICSNCGNMLPRVFTGKALSQLFCPHCNHLN
ncbi:MAG: hypothetical protein Q7K45_01800 [Nanoarchaeota archaeon]|nr:hypothetical protein [Nanoarchaeota archaeon]